MWFTNLLFTFSGRIPRSRWWLGVLFLVAVSMVVQLALIDWSAIDLESGVTPPPTFLQKIATLVFFVPIIAIYLKRLNDRDWPSWVIWVVVACALPTLIGPFFGYFVDYNKFTQMEWVAMVPSIFVGLFLLIDNGFLKGTDGPNSHGPDPLENMS